MTPAAVALPVVLVVTATAGFRHSSIETAEQVIAAMAPRLGYVVQYARDESQMSEAFAHLDNVKVVIFANTTGDLNVDGRDMLLEWIRNGGSFIGTHSASDTWHNWPDYIAMLGGEFDHHPDQTTRALFVETRFHLATASLESPFDLFEEFYLFRNFERDNVQMLLSLRESPEDGSSGFFPIAWFRNYGKGRVFYTALGHREDVWTSAWFQQHLAGAIAWGLRRDQVPRRRAVHS